MPVTDEIKDLNDRFYLILNELVAIYPAYKANPASLSVVDNTKTNKQVHDMTMSLMQNLQNDYFLYKNNIVAANDKLRQNITEGNSEVTVLETQNQVLALQLANIQTSSYSAEGLFDDAQITRNQLLVSNWILFAIIVGGGVMYYKSLTVQ
jgi:hypothetical protein